MSGGHGTTPMFAYTVYTWAQAADRIGVAEERIPALVKEGLLISLQRGFITTDSVERYRIYGTGAHRG